MDGLRVNIFEQIFIFGWTIQLIIITYLIIINNEYIISIIYLFNFYYFSYTQLGNQSQPGFGVLTYQGQPMGLWWSDNVQLSYVSWREHD